MTKQFKTLGDIPRPARTGDNSYQALVFGPADTIRRSVLEIAHELVEAGGTVLFIGKLPTASAEAVRNDPALKSLLVKMLGTDTFKQLGIVSRQSRRGGYCAFLPTERQDELPNLVTFKPNHGLITPCPPTRGSGSIPRTWTSPPSRPYIPAPPSLDSSVRFVYDWSRIISTSTIHSASITGLSLPL